MYTYSDDLISDLHKDARGFRPSREFAARWADLTPGEKQSLWDSLCDELNFTLAEDAAAEAKALADFESDIATAFKIGAPDRQTAIRWTLAANGIEIDRMQDAGHICYTLGLSFALAPEFKELFT